jgi:CHAT domain
MINILAFHASPSDQNELRLNAEIREIQQVLLAQPFRGLFDYNLKVHPAAQVHDLQTYLLSDSPRLVHFSGHGSRRGLYVEQPNGSSALMKNTTIKALFQNLSGSIQCVLLNSCYSEKQAQEIAKYVPCVVGMTSAVEDDVAISFSRSFYQALVYGKSVGDSFDMARGIIDSIKKYGKQDVKLHVRKGDNADEIFLVRPPRLSAMLLLDDRDRPEQDDNDLYGIEFEIVNVPANAFSVTLHFNHETIPEDAQYDTITNDGTGFTSQLWLYGNIEIKVTIWLMDLRERDRGNLSFSNQYAYGFTQTLYNALMESVASGEAWKNKAVLKAIEEIGKN